MGRANFICGLILIFTLVCSLRAGSVMAGTPSVVFTPESPLAGQVINAEVYFGGCLGSASNSDGEYYDVNVENETIIMDLILAGAICPPVIGMELYDIGGFPAGEYAVEIYQVPPVSFPVDPADRELLVESSIVISGDVSAQSIPASGLGGVLFLSCLILLIGIQGLRQ